MVGIRPVLDPNGTLESIVKIGATKEDAKGAADFRRIRIDRVPVWVDLAVQSLVGRHPHMPSRPAAWRLVMKAGCVRLQKQPEVRRMRSRNMAAIMAPVDPHGILRMARRRPYEFALLETLVGGAGHINAFDRHADFVETYAAEMRLSEDDTHVIVAAMGLASSTGMTGGGFVPDVYMGMAMVEHETFTDWAYKDVYGQK